MIILRLKYKKELNMKFLSHLELIRTIERVFRRMKVPMDFSKGYSPKPKINYAAPLPVGVSSECECLNVELLEKIDIENLLEIQGQYMPKGLTFVEGRYCDKANSLMSMVSDSTYLAEIETETVHTMDEVQGWRDAFLELKNIEYEKENKRKKIVTVDIRPYIKEMKLVSVEEHKIMFEVSVTTGSNGNLKPEKLISMFVEHFKIDSVASREMYKRVSLSSRDKSNKLVDLYEV